MEHPVDEAERQNWWRNELERRERDEGPRRAAILKPADAFENRRSTAGLRAEYGWERTPDELGPDSPTVDRRITSSCAGWAERPTAREFYDAVRAERPNQREQSLIAMWVRDATDAEMNLAWIEEVYTDQELVAAIHRSGAAEVNPKRNADLNRWTVR